MNYRPMTGIIAAAALLSVVGSGCVIAQGVSGITFPPSRQIPAGTRMNVKLLTRLSSAYANVGDPVRAEVTTPVANGLPVGTILDGQVTEVQSGTVKHPGMIDIAFGGRSSNGGVNGALATARIVGSSAVSQKSQDVGIGAGAGALLGLTRKRKLGDALAGAALGALGGFAVDQAQKHPASDVTLKKGAMIPIRIDRPLSLRTEINAY